MQHGVRHSRGGGGDFSEIPRAYLNRTAVAEHQRPDAASFQFVGYSQKKITARQDHYSHFTFT